MSALTKIFGTHSDRELKRITPLVDKVESYRDGMKALSDEELKGKTINLQKKIISSAIKKVKSLNNYLGR